MIIRVQVNEGVTGVAGEEWCGVVGKCPADFHDALTVYADLGHCSLQTPSFGFFLNQEGVFTSVIGRWRVLVCAAMFTFCASGKCVV